MSIRLAVFDLDQTLLLTGHRITDRAAAQVRALVADGLPVALASARLDESMTVVNEAIGVPLPRISYNGALTRGADGSTVHEVGFTVSDELAEALVAMTRPGPDGQGAINVYVSDGRWLAHGRAEAIDREERDTWCTATVRTESVEAESLAGLRCRKILVEGPDGHLDALERAVDGIGGLNLTHSGLGLHDIWPVASGKGNALAALSQHLGLGDDQVLAAGDSATDVPMLRWAGTSIAVQPCAPAVAGAATHRVEGAGSDDLFALVRELAGLAPVADLSR